MAFSAGGFPGIGSQRRMTQRAPVNPMDKSTIVSIYPRPISDKKITITPGVFKIEPGSYDNPSVLVVGSSSWWKETGENEPMLEIPNGSVQVADAFIKDYCNGMVGCNMADAMPGLFWVPGEHTSKDILEKFQPRLLQAKLRQIKYYQELIKMADSLWARTNGNPLVVNDDMRLAANQLSLGNKEWMRDFTAMEKTNCKACGHLIDTSYPVCPNCKTVINPEKAKELGLQFVQ